MTPREYFYTLDARGNLILDGAILDDPHFLDFFFRRLRINDSGHHPDYSHYSPCGPELNFVAYADTPLVFQRLENGRLFYSPSLTVDFDATSLSFGQNGVLYHAAPLGTWGRLAPNLAIELSKNISRWGEWYLYDDKLSHCPEVIPPQHIPEGKTLMRPRAGNKCVGCGRDSVNGLCLSFLFDALTKSADSWLTADERQMGSLNIMHGGHVALLLDETMGKVLSGLNIKAPTAQLDVKYRRPVPIGVALHLHAKLTRIEGRKNYVHGEIRSCTEPEELHSEADAMFISLR